MSRARIFDSEKNTRNLYNSITGVRPPDNTTLEITYSNPQTILDLSIPSFEGVLGVSNLDNTELIYIQVNKKYVKRTITSTVGNTSYVILNPVFPAGWNIAVTCQVKFLPYDKAGTAISTSLGSFYGPTSSSTLSATLQFEESKQLGQRSFDIVITIWGLGLRISMD